MESIEQMIKRLCPKGVEWKKISEIGTVMRGTSFQKKHFTDEGTPCIHYGQIYTQYAHHVYETFSFVGEEISRSPRRAKTGALIMATTSENIEDVGKCIVWLGEKDIIVSNDACFIQHSLNPKYLGYLLQTDYFNAYKKKVATGTKVIRINADAVADFVIPVPPLEIQSRIVEVLDKMATLTAELKAELEARKQQYEYYRNKLLSFNEIGEANRQVTWKKISEIGQICMCKRIMKDQTHKQGEIPFYKIGTFGGTADAYISRELFEDYRARFKFPKKGDLLISAAGTIGKTVVFDGKDSYFQDSNIVWVDNDETIVTNRYLYHIYKIINWKTDGGTIRRLYNDNLRNTIIPVPSMQEQQRIVSILDRFEALTTDLQSGLPAEIEARRQQYEYYQNKLLTFEAV